MDMSEAKVFDMFKRSLKYQIWKELMISNPSIVNIAIAQQILTVYKPASNFWDPSGPTLIKLENLWRKEDFAPEKHQYSRFGGKIWRQGISNFQKNYANIGMVQGVARVRDNSECYACERTGHIAKFC